MLHLSSCGYLLLLNISIPEIQKPKLSQHNYLTIYNSNNRTQRFFLFFFFIYLVAVLQHFFSLHLTVRTAGRGRRGFWDLELMKGKHKVHTEVSQGTQESSSLAGYERHSFDLDYYAWHFTSLLVNSSSREEHFPKRCLAVPSVMFGFVSFSCRLWKSIPSSFYLSAECRTYSIMLQISMIIPRVLMWKHLSASCMMSQWFYLPGRSTSHIVLKSASSVHPDRSQPAPATPSFAKPVLEHSGLSASQCSTQGFTMCCGSERDKGYDKHLLCKAAC